MEIRTFRQLYHSLYEYQGEHPFQDILLPWSSNAKQNMARIESYGYPDAIHRPWRRGQDEIEDDLWRWYALSRVSDYLLLALQAPIYQYDIELLKRAYKPLIRPKIQLSEYIQFFVDLDMQPFDHKKFHPFFHEIAEVEQAEDPLEPITLVKVFWPGFMFHDLLFSRAGVKVRGGSRVINKEIAEKSTLYFTYIRRNRPVSDLSHGWGSNSQWRTRFRRDYQDNDIFYYNIDGNHDLTSTDRVLSKLEERLTEPLQRAERIELLINRCFIYTDKPHHELWPFDDTYVEKKGSASATE